jgi:transcriptional regulator with XRE-family HTH domain
MSRLKAFNPERIQEIRKSSGFNQTEYWKRFGVTQSGGSRYETGRTIPTPTAMLLWLRDAGRITDQDLADALKAVKANRR